MKVSIVMPAHNEEDSIGKILDEIAKKISPEVITEIIVVDDHSTDKTSEVVREKGQKHSLFNIKVIPNTTPAGFANALRRGIEETKTELVLHLMGDGCDRIEDIPLMFEEFRNSQIDMVCGSRYTQTGERKGGSVLKGFFSRIVGVSLHFIINIPTRDCSNAFKMYKREILNAITLKSSGFEISMELCLKAYLSGFKIKELPTVWHERDEGSSDFKMFKQSFAYIKLYLWAVFKYFKNRIYGVKSHKYEIENEI